MCLAAQIGNVSYHPIFPSVWCFLVIDLSAGCLFVDIAKTNADKGLLHKHLKWIFTKTEDRSALEDAIAVAYLGKPA